MKRKILFLVMLLVFSGSLVFQSCKKESTPTEIYNAFTIPELVAPTNGTFISVTGGTVDLKWSSTDADNAPQNWDVYFGPSEEPGKVKTGNTSQTYTVNVSIGTKYYWRVVGFDSRGVPSKSETWSFEVINPDAPLNVKLEWTTNILDAIGIDVAPETAANLRLKILNEAGAVVKIVNTNKFEEYSFLSTLPDGKYKIVTDLASTVNAGDFNKSINISLKLSMSQRGIISEVYQFPDAMTNDFVCGSYYSVLAEVTKTGSTYAITSIGKAEWSADLASLAGDWHGLDNMGYDDVVTLSYAGGVLSMHGLGFGWIQDWWGEAIQTGGTVPLVFDWATLGQIDIEDQFYVTTLYGGDLYDYNIVGTAKLSLCGATPVLRVVYDVKYTADGWSIGAYVKHLFIVSLTPVTKGSMITAPGSTSSVERPLPQKPVHQVH